MKRDDLRQKLIDGTIDVIAEEGLDKATTKQVGSKTNINEAYIYRCFNGKEDMFTKTFDFLDFELIDTMMRNVDVMYMTGLDFEIRCRVFFFKIWEFLIGNRKKCLTYVRYYYSPYFSKYSAASHKARYLPLVDKFKDAFKGEADVWMILSHILNVMLDFAVKVHNDQMPSEDNYAEHVFRVIYRSVEQYFKKEEVKSNE